MSKSDVDWVYLSPHLDDGVYSCGGLVWEHVKRGEQVSVWTVCAGDPPSRPLSSFAQALHSRWRTGREAVVLRRREDERACRRLGARFWHINLPDCIYRRHPETGESLYASEEAIFGEVHEAERGLIEELTSIVKREISAATRLVCPLGIGGHVDHRLTRQVAEALEVAPVYYADYPYIDREGAGVRMKDLVPEGYKRMRIPVSEKGVKAWVEAMGMYASQLSTFWSNQEEMQLEVREYKERNGGVVLWRAEA